MVELTLFEQLEYLVGMIVSTPLILFLLFLLILIISLLLAYKKKQVEVTERALKGTIFLGLIIIFFMYHTPILKLLDGFIENLIKMIYFPNIVIYTLIIIVSNIILIYGIINKKNLISQIPTFINTLTIDFLAIILFQEIKKGTIDIYNEIGLNSEKELLIILQLTTEIFALYMLITLLIRCILYLIKLKDKNLKQKVKNKKLLLIKNERIIRKEIIDFETLEKEE